MEHSEGRTKWYDQRLQQILARSAEVFASKGFHRASVRDISRKTEISLAGLYYYFQTKEELLFLIIHTAFDTALENLKASVGNHKGPDQVRFFIQNHLRIFIENLSVAKVVVHEADFLTGEYRERIQEKQRDYFEFLLDLLLRQRSGTTSSATDPKLAALALFGMMNWIYTWYDPGKNTPEEVAAAISNIFLNGYLNS